MRYKSLDYGFSLLTLLLGLYIIRVARDLGYFLGVVPGPGFFPFWCGVVLAVFSVLQLLQTWRAGKDGEAMARGLLATAAGLVAVVACYVIVAPRLGLLLPLPLFVIASAFVIEPRMSASLRRKVLGTAIGLPIVSYFVFVRLLNVPLIKGPFGF